MIRLLFVGDGERDAATIPRIVEIILSTSVGAEFHRWARLHGSGRGYKQKLRFAYRQAQDAGAKGLVATVDCDKDRKGQKLKKLRQARRDERQESPLFPTALGEAVPHAEAWLLDDPVAVRETLTLAPDAEVPNVRDVASPKNALDELIAASDSANDVFMDVCRRVAQQLDPSRCVHARETGFKAFVSEVRDEIGPLMAS